MEKELVHYGILGMKWGVRRYQNPDGTLTAAGRRRIRASSGGISNKKLSNLKSVSDSSRTIAKESSNIVKTAGDIKRAPSRKSISNMTDAELKTKVSRMNMEQRYRDLSARNVSKGESYIRGVMEMTGSSLALLSSSLAIALSIRALKDKG